MPLFVLKMLHFTLLHDEAAGGYVGKQEISQGLDPLSAGICRFESGLYLSTVVREICCSGTEE